MPEGIGSLFFGPGREAASPASVRPFRTKLGSVLAAALLCGLVACSFSPGKKTRNVAAQTSAGTGPAAETTLMPRADPGYVQYLERQSMLYKSSEMAMVVSGSGIAWRNAAAGGSSGLLKHANTWVLIHPMTMLTSSQSSVFSQLSESATWPVLREIGASGLYIAPIQGGGFLWAKGRKGTDIGDDVVQYDFSRTAGEENRYKRLMREAIGNNVVIGSDLVPAATGLGPDFFLALRGVREYPGIYCMVEIPDADWKLLPEVNTEAEGAVLGPAQVEALDRQGLLPKSMRGELSPLSRAGGWAVTGEMRGVDGINRRWVYRYYRNPSYAVLNWEDPSQAAHRILSGSAVRQVGLQGQALIGLRFEAFQGLEPVVDGAGSGRTFSIEPARTAAQSMGREINRYGAWSWVRDDGLPLNVLGDFLASGVDYIFDGVFSPAAEHALLTGDAGAARFMADEALRLGLDFSRLAHVMPAQDGINYTLPYLAGGGADGEKAAALRDAVRSAVRSVAGNHMRDDRLYATGASLAAMALNADPASAIKEIQNGHALLIFFKAMQPGLLMLAGQDLCGVLPLSSDAQSGDRGGPEDAIRGGYGLGSVSSMRAVSTMGTARAPQLYPPPDMQVHGKDSFLRRIGAFLRPRKDYDIGGGRLIARPATKEKGSIALLTRLPDGRFLLSLCNFSRSAVNEVVDLSGIPGSDQATPRVTPVVAGGTWSVSGKRISIGLGPWQGTALILGAESVDANGKKSDTADASGKKSDAADASGKKSDTADEQR
jgi:trehalose synthase